MINVLHGNASIFVNQFQTAFHFQCNQFNSITFDDGLDPAAAGWIHPLNPAWIGGKYQSMEQLLMFECKCFGHSVEYWMLFSRKFSPLFRLLLFGPIPVCILANNKPNQGLVKKWKKPKKKKKKKRVERRVFRSEAFLLLLLFWRVVIGCCFWCRWDLRLYAVYGHWEPIHSGRIGSRRMVRPSATTIASTTGVSFFYFSLLPPRRSETLNTL